MRMIFSRLILVLEKKSQFRGLGGFLGCDGILCNFGQ